MPRIINEIKLDYKDVLIRPKRSMLRSRNEVELLRTFNFRRAGVSWTGVPIIAANMDTTGTFAMAEALAKEKCVTAIHKHYSIAEWREWAAKVDPVVFQHVAVSSGAGKEDFAALETLLTEVVPDVPFVCLDIANGHTEMFVEVVRKARATFPNKILIAGNVCTAEMTEELLMSGADIVKVGIGPGSVCTTRKQTGVGYPQLSAVLECADAAHGLGGAIVADGGCTVPGDLAKAFGAGADYVMLGGMLSGHDESGGELVEKDGQHFKEFYGMSSATAMTRYKGGVSKYRASEGKHVLVPYRGCVADTMQDTLGGLRSACTYAGAAKLKWLPRCTTFVRVTAQINTVFNSYETGRAAPGGADYKSLNQVASSEASSEASGEVCGL